MRHLLGLLCLAVLARAQDAKAAVDWAEIEKQMSALRAAVESRDIKAASDAAQTVSRTTQTAYLQQAPTPADYLRKVEEQVAANPNTRLTSLPYLAMMAAQAGSWEKARTYAQDALGTENPAYDTVHVPNNVLGLVALHNGDVASAEAYLLAAGRTKGSTRMRRWGPTLAQAKELLAQGRNETVLEYFVLCRGFVTENAKLDDWIATLKGGRAPDLSREYLWYQ